MQDTDLLKEGVTLMVLGMGFVFVFLTVLVLTTTLMSWLIRRYFPEPVASAMPSRQRLNVAGEPDNADPVQNAALMAVIGAAVHRHRQQHRR